MSDAPDKCGDCQYAARHGQCDLYWTRHQIQVWVSRTAPPPAWCPIKTKGMSLVDKFLSGVDLSDLAREYAGGWYGDDDPMVDVDRLGVELRVAIAERLAVTSAEGEEVSK